MSEELHELIKKINDHCTEENQGGYRNLSIGRGDISLLGIQKVIWIHNTQPAPTFGRQYDVNGNFKGTYSTGVKEALTDDGSIAIGKNKEYARLILANYQGTHSCLFDNGREQTFLIRNSAHYINNRTSIDNLHIGIGGMKDWIVFPSLQYALKELEKAELAIRKKQEAEAEILRKAEELKRQKQEEEAKKAEAEAKRIQEEIKQEEIRRNSILEEAQQAKSFIRRQVSLKRNPILDKNQDKAKFSNLYNGVAVIINGGPGTGKTTTMIQRLKLMIDVDDLKDYIDNHKDCKLTKAQLDIIESKKNNWIYFSPNDLLKKYLQDNMSYEGLVNANKLTAVWNVFLKDAARDEYHLAGLDCPFDFPKKSMENKVIYLTSHLQLIKDFTNYYIDSIKEKIIKVSNFDVSKYEWKTLGRIVTSECAKVCDIENIEQLMRFLINLESLDKNIVIQDKQLPTGSEISKKYNEDVRNLSNKIIQSLKEDESRYAEVVEYVRAQMKDPKDELEENEDAEENEDSGDHGDVGIAIFNRVYRLLKKLALKNCDKTTKLTEGQKKILELIDSFFDSESIAKLSDSAMFVKNIYPVLRNFNQLVFNPIPQYYKAYRRAVYESAKGELDSGILEMIIKNKNRLLLHQEQDLLIGFINNVARTLFRVSSERFLSSNNKYVTAYRELCRPVIGVDEATDYSIMDFYCIKSFGHYMVSSYTLCGDTMQLMKEDGISDWNVLKDPLLFDKIDIHNLTISYRQSYELLKLANAIYSQEMGRPSPYKCYLKKTAGSPKPLWLESKDIDEKAEWISERVLEIVKVYGCVPTIAIFTKNKETADGLRVALEDCNNLTSAGIEVKVCSDNTLEGEKTLRIFPIDQVKGMEFESVFFYDIDDIESSRLINKYIYVGLSRASMYLAVMSNGETANVSKELKGKFSLRGNWK